MKGLDPHGNGRGEEQGRVKDGENIIQICYVTKKNLFSIKEKN